MTGASAEEDLSWQKRDENLAENFCDEGLLFSGQLCQNSLQKYLVRSLKWAQVHLLHKFLGSCSFAAV